MITMISKHNDQDIQVCSSSPPPSQDMVYHLVSIFVDGASYCSGIMS